MFSILVHDPQSLFIVFSRFKGNFIPRCSIVGAKEEAAAILLEDTVEVGHLTEFSRSAVGVAQQLPSLDYSTSHTGSQGYAHKIFKIAANSVDPFSLGKTVCIVVDMDRQTELVHQ